MAQGPCTRKCMGLRPGGVGLCVIVCVCLCACLPICPSVCSVCLSVCSVCLRVSVSVCVGPIHQLTISIKIPQPPCSAPREFRPNTGPEFSKNSGPSQGFSEDLHPYPSTTRASFAATVPKSTQAGDLGPDRLRSISPFLSATL